MKKEKNMESEDCDVYKVNFKITGADLHGGVERYWEDVSFGQFESIERAHLFLRIAEHVYHVFQLMSGEGE